jgi:Rap1a immunity proteins
MSQCEAIMRRLAIVPFMACLLLSFEAQGGLLDSGSTLLPACKKYVQLIDGAKDMSTSDAADGLACESYVVGFNDGVRSALRIAATKAYGLNKTVRWTQDERSARLGNYCLPEGMQTGQAVRVVVKYMEAHPENLHRQPFIVVDSALRDAFPCK